MIKNKIIYLLSISILTVTLSSCSFGKESIIEEVQSGSVTDFFSKNSDNEVEVYFLDMDNISTGDDDPVRTYNTIATTSVGSCESYIIKSGNTEILVDAGYQTFEFDSCTKEDYPYTFTYQNLKDNIYSNLLKKITSICTDGILDYLIVTHNDFDHIASLCVEGGVIDAFNSHEVITNLDGNNVELQKISNVIDYNSGVIALHSYSEIDKSKRLCKALYQTYITKVSDLVENGTNYLPAAALFDYDIIASDDSKMTLENKLLATPNNMKKNIEEFNTKILTESNPNDAAKEFVNDTPKNSSYKTNVEKLNGSLNVENGKYYYSIPLESESELRILYNWYYDFAYRQSFNGQSINNPSVCFEVVNENFKFLSCGDLGGNGESGLINYYSDTSILNDVTLFKASHHGSISNSENSEALYSIILPKIIVVTGCAQSPLEVKNVTAAYMKQGFFDNIYNAYHDEEGNLKETVYEEPYLLCTNIDWYRLNELNNLSMNESKPFYGDIHIYYKEKRTHLDYSYTGNIHALVKTGPSDDVVDFKTFENGKIVKIQETEWFKKVGFTYGGDNI